MSLHWAHAWPSVAAAFIASLVEFVEALTVVLAVGTVRGWRWSLAGAGAALAVLLATTALLGPTLARIPLGAVQLVGGALLLLFGLRWLRKAILRAAGVIPLHDEAAAFVEQAETMRRRGAAGMRWDSVAFAASFEITMIEGVEVLFIVMAVGSAGAGLLVPASVGALAALAVVVLVGSLLHRPLTRVPENTLKFAVGVLLSAFGTFWFGEGLGLQWAGGDLALVALNVGFLAIAMASVALCRARAPPRAARNA